jgi:hypothetical protein
VDMHRSGYFMRAMRGVPSRRDVLRSLAGAGLGVGIVRFPDLAAAKKRKRKKKVKKAKPNEYGCLEVGAPCTSEDQCCSGICAGKKGKRTCRAHHTGTCRQDGLLVPCNNRTTCGCLHTTAGSDICSELFVPGGSACAACQRDADCEALGFPPGSACGLSAIPCESGTMACYVPCGSVMTEE